MEVPRRSVVALGLGVLAAGCSQHAAVSPTPAHSPSSRSTAPTAPHSPAALPAVTAWRPGRGELVPACKLAAVRRIESRGNSADTALQVIDAQYGGLLADRASVLVVTRSWRRSGEEVRSGGHTFDVRLTWRTSGWRVTAVDPSRPGPRTPSPSRRARRVLAGDRITLPPAAAADVASGQVHESVLAALLAVSRSHRIDVSVIRSGHPLHVFGTTRLSDHPQGRAFDTWAVDGHAVVDPRTSRALVEDYMHAVAAAGSYNVGGPYLLGAAPQWFSDDTHHDHVHSGFLT